MAVRTRPWLTTGLIAAAGVVAMLWVVFARLAAPADGTVAYPSAPPWGPDGVVIQEVHAEGSPLRPGDRVVAVNGVPLAAGPVGDVGDRPVYRVVRGGETLELTVPLVAYPIRDVLGDHAAVLPFVVVELVVAGFVVRRRPRDPAARALFGIAVLQAAGGAAYPFASQVVDVATGRLWPTVVSDTANALLWGAMLHFATVFPNRWPILRRRPRLTALAYVIPFLLYGLSLAMGLPGANALQRLGVLAAVSPPAANVLPVVIVAALVTSFALAKRDPAARQRMRWQVYTFGFGVAAYLGLGRLPEWLTGRPLLGWDVLTLFFLPCPIALGAAVLRYRLFDIQVILRRSLVYGLLSAALVLGALGVAAVLRLLSGRPVDPVPFAAAVLVTLVTVSVGRHLRRVVGRQVFGDRDDPYEVLRQLADTLESTSSPQAVLDHVTHTLARTLRLTYVAIEVSGGHTSSHGTPSAAPATIPLLYQDEHNGRLVLDTGPLHEPFGERDRRLLDAVARQVGVIAHNLVLGERLRRSLERTITALEEERRRMRRDIHDGLGPTLASVTMRLELARSLMHTDPATADVVFDGLVQTHQHALRDVRRLIDGLRPPVLDQLGLVPAVRERAARLSGGVTITVEAGEDVASLPAAAEVAAYHIISEALTNVVKHADATGCVVRLRRDDDLRIEVADDGVGLPPDYHAGVGLRSIRERCAALGGSADIRTRDGGGTLVTARLPAGPRHQQPPGDDGRYRSTAARSPAPADPGATADIDRAGPGSATAPATAGGG
ncbi:histidine kinase [Dactylosporangium sp. NBC_01737]|uniref:sensor histidine kinase n=1 Tax=Dactylosporangium sp. NBC_01737 TaxID=2975959 RepID=UPI002E151CB9|nr:histidine kinase [Dactylosporangium sp. NBC_01737]